MTSIAERLRLQAGARLEKVPLSKQHNALIEVEADDLGALVKATPEGLEGAARLARDSYAVSSVASAGRLVAVRADHVLALAQVAVAGESSPAAVPPMPAAVDDPDGE